MENSNLNNISKKNKQFELFSSALDTSSNLPFSNNLKVRSKTLMAWRNRISDYQSKIVEDNQNNIFQHSIIPENDNIYYERIHPFSLQGLSLNFWRTNQFVHNGPAMYFVIDTIVKSCYKDTDLCKAALYKIHNYQKNAAMNKNFSCQTRLLGLEANLIMAMNSNFKRKEAKSIIDSIKKYC